jgi:hypothetical protein
MSKQDYKRELTEREYPLYQTVRMRKENVRRIKARISKYGQTFDSIVEKMLNTIEQYESEKKERAK